MAQMKQSSNSVKPCSITSELVGDFLSYSTAIFSRALPDCVDGLKTAQRRSLLGISDLSLWHSSPYCKVSRLEGHVLGRYHPNGGCANTIINLGQQSAQRYALTDIHGNCGGSIQTGPCAGQKVSADGPAAARYLEVRATPFSESLYLSQIDRGLGEWRPNYDNSSSEPVRIVPALPALLLTGSTGIAAGYAAHHIPYNLSDVINATVAWIGNKKITQARLFSKFCSPPEPPQGGRVLRNEDSIRELMATGKGQVEVYGKWEYGDRVRWGKRGHKPGIIITHLASGSSEEFVDRVHDLAEKGKLEGLISVADHSSRDGIRIEMIVKDVAHRDEIIRALIDGTGLRHTYNVNATAVGLNGKPALFGVKQAIEVWYGQRVKYLVQKHEKEATRLETESKKLKAVMAVISSLDKFLKIVRTAKDKKSAVEQVCKIWTLKPDMAEHVLAIPVSTLIATESEKVKQKLQSILDEMAALQRLCVEGADLDKFIIEEIRGLKSLGTAPRSEWIDERPLPSVVAKVQPSAASGRDRIVAEAKALGLTTRSINKWLRENVGQGVELRWQQYKNLLESGSKPLKTNDPNPDLPKPRTNRTGSGRGGKTPVSKRASGPKREKPGSGKRKPGSVTAQARSTGGGRGSVSSGPGAAPVQGSDSVPRKRRSPQRHRSEDKK